MIELDDKENQSPLRLGYGKSPSPKKSRSKSIGPGGLDVSDAPSSEQPPYRCRMTAQLIDTYLHLRTY